VKELSALIQGILRFLPSLLSRCHPFLPPSLSPSFLCYRASTNCDLFVLTKTDLDMALSYYPKIAEQIREVAGNRANLVKKRSQIAAKAAAEGKSASDAAKAAAQVCTNE